VAHDSRDDVFDGGASRDELFFASLGGPVTVDLATGQLSGNGDDLVKSIEVVLGTGGADTLLGDGRANTLLGFEGADDIEGRGGNDFLNGGDGTDSLDGGNGTDTCKRGETVLNCEA
jgi:Ca2+-binding RTX toxin-like protein